MNLDQKVTFAETVFAQEVDGEMVLLDMESENYFGLDEVGTAIWQAMQEKETLKEVLETLLEQYEVEEEIFEDIERDGLSGIHRRDKRAHTVLGHYRTRPLSGHQGQEQVRLAGPDRHLFLFHLSCGREHRHDDRARAGDGPSPAFPELRGQLDAGELLLHRRAAEFRLEFLRVLRRNRSERNRGEGSRYGRRQGARMRGLRREY